MSTEVGKDKHLRDESSSSSRIGMNSAARHRHTARNVERTGE